MSLPDEIFATTRWTIVLAAGRAETPQSADALQQLCTAYWFPLYAYVRRRGYSKEDAEDLTQAFFADLLGRRDIGKRDGGNGKFRAFLLVALKHFLSNERDKAGRLKRGGHATHLSLDWQTADTQFQIADLSGPSPEQAYDREWAMALLERVIGRLRGEWIAEGRGARFEELKEFLTLGKGEVSYAERAAALGVGESLLRVTAHRLRKRYREMLRAEVADTLSDPGMVEEELRVLLGAFG